MKLSEMLTIQQKTELFLAGCRSAGIEVREGNWWAPNNVELYFAKRKAENNRDYKITETIFYLMATMFVTELLYVAYIVVMGCMG